MFTVWCYRRKGLMTDVGRIVLSILPMPRSGQSLNTEARWEVGSDRLGIQLSATASCGRLRHLSSCPRAKPAKCQSMPLLAEANGVFRDVQKKLFGGGGAGGPRC